MELLGVRSTSSHTRELDCICSNIFKEVKAFFTKMSFCEMAIYRTDEAGDSLEAGDWELNACPLSLLELTLLHHSALYPCPLVASWEPAQVCGLHDLPDSLLMQGNSNIAKLLESRR